MEKTITKGLTVSEYTTKYLSVKSKLYRYLVRQCHLNREDARDILQEVYYKLLKHIDSFDSTTPANEKGAGEWRAFDAWLWMATKRLFIDKYRKDARYRVDLVEDDEILELHLKSSKNDVDNSILKEDIAKAIMTIKNLRDRRLAEMFYNGYKYEEMVEELQQPMGTIKNRLHDVKKMLAVQLNSYRTK
jgi:RNA polymerase sigma-70 factor (ECF subfamily)